MCPTPIPHVPHPNPSCAPPQSFVYPTPIPHLYLPYPYSFPLLCMCPSHMCPSPTCLQNANQLYSCLRSYPISETLIGRVGGHSDQFSACTRNHTHVHSHTPTLSLNHNHSHTPTHTPLSLNHTHTTPTLPHTLHSHSTTPHTLPHTLHSLNHTHTHTPTLPHTFHSHSTTHTYTPTLPHTLHSLNHTHTPLPHSHTLSTLTQPHTHTPRTQWKVRRVLAYSLHELARILGPEHTCTDLFSVFQEYCTKDIDDVKIGAVSHLTEFFEVGACQFLTVPNTVAFTVNRLSGNAIHGPLSVAKHESTFNHKDDIGKFLKPHSLRGA